MSTTREKMIGQAEAVLLNVHEPRRVAAVVIDAIGAVEMADAIEATEALDGRDCPECGGEGAPEECADCWPAADDARWKRRTALAKATGVAGDT